MTPPSQNSLSVRSSFDFCLLTSSSSRRRRHNPRRRHQRLIPTLRLLASLNKPHRIKLLVPSRHHSQHLHPVLLHIALVKQSLDPIPQLPQPQMQQRNPPIPQQSLHAVMLVKIPVPVPILLQLKSNRKPPHRLPAQVRDRRTRRMQNLVILFPNPIAEIHFLVVIEKPLIKSPQLLQQLPAEQNTAPALPINLSLALTFKTTVFILPQPQRHQEIMPVRRKRPRWILIRPVRIQHPAP